MANPKVKFSKANNILAALEKGLILRSLDTRSGVSLVSLVEPAVEKVFYSTSDLKSITEHKAVRRSYLSVDGCVFLAYHHVDNKDILFFVVDIVPRARNVSEYENKLVNELIDSLHIVRSFSKAETSFVRLRSLFQERNERSDLKIYSLPDRKLKGVDCGHVLVCTDYMYEILSAYFLEDDIDDEDDEPEDE